MKTMQENLNMHVDIDFTLHKNEMIAKKVANIHILWHSFLHFQFMVVLLQDSVVKSLGVLDWYNIDIKII